MLKWISGSKNKRWLNGTDRQRNLAIIDKLKNIPKENRKIKFITAIALSNGKEAVCTLEILDGYVAQGVRGDNGFGFDEIFELENGKTLAELTNKEKNEISARKKSNRRIKKQIRECRKIGLIELIILSIGLGMDAFAWIFSWNNI